MSSTPKTKHFSSPPTPSSQNYGLGPRSFTFNEDGYSTCAEMQSKHSFIFDWDMYAPNLLKVARLFEPTFGKTPGLFSTSMLLKSMKWDATRIMTEPHNHRDSIIYNKIVADGASVVPGSTDEKSYIDFIKLFEKGTTIDLQNPDPLNINPNVNTNPIMVAGAGPSRPLDVTDMRYCVGNNHDPVANDLEIVLFLRGIWFQKPILGSGNWGWLTPSSRNNIFVVIIGGSPTAAGNDSLTTFADYSLTQFRELRAIIASTMKPETAAQVFAFAQVEYPTRTPYIFDGPCPFSSTIPRTVQDYFGCSNPKMTSMDLSNFCGVVLVGAKCGSNNPCLIRVLFFPLHQVTRIGEGFFSDNPCLESFYASSINNNNNSAALKSIAQGMFEGCYCLTEIDLGGAACNVEELEGDSFGQGTPGLTDEVINCQMPKLLENLSQAQQETRKANVEKMEAQNVREMNSGTNKFQRAQCNAERIVCDNANRHVATSNFSGPGRNYGNKDDRNHNDTDRQKERLNDLELQVHRAFGSETFMNGREFTEQAVKEFEIYRSQNSKTNSMFSGTSLNISSNISTTSTVASSTTTTTAARINNNNNHLQNNNNNNNTVVVQPSSPAKATGSPRTYFKDVAMKSGNAPNFVAAQIAKNNSNQSSPNQQQQQQQQGIDDDVDHKFSRQIRPRDEVPVDNNIFGPNNNPCPEESDKLKHQKQQQEEEQQQQQQNNHNNNSIEDCAEEQQQQQQQQIDSSSSPNRPIGGLSKADPIDVENEEALVGDNFDQAQARNSAEVIYCVKEEVVTEDGAAPKSRVKKMNRNAIRRLNSFIEEEADEEECEESDEEIEEEEEDENDFLTSDEEEDDDTSSSSSSSSSSASSSASGGGAGVVPDAPVQQDEQPTSFEKDYSNIMLDEE